MIADAHAPPSAVRGTQSAPMLSRLGSLRVSGRWLAPIPLAGAIVIGCATAIAWLWGPAQEGYFDSAFYLDGARHLARGEGYVSAYVALDRTSFEPITHWAPGTSVLIALAIVLGFPPLTAAAVVLGVCYVAAVALVFALGVALAGKRYWPASLLVSLLFAVLPGTLHWLDALLSDLPCATFFLLNLRFAAWVMRADPPSLGLRFGWGLCLAFMVLLRYAGLLFIPGLLVACVLGMQARRTLVVRAFSLWPTLLSCGLGVWAWNLRNQRLASEAFGDWIAASSEVLPHAERAAFGVFVWIHPLLREAQALGLGQPLQLLLWAAALSLLPLLAASARGARRELGLLLLAALGYYALMVATAATRLIASLDETRFWVPIWAMTFLTFLVVIARAQPRWCLPFKIVLLTALACALGLFGRAAYRALPEANQPRRLLEERWARAAAVLPEPRECRPFIMDPRPFMLHRALPPTSTIPDTFAEFEAAARHFPAVCLIVTDGRLLLSKSAERRRVAIDAVLATLREQDRVWRSARGDGVAVYRLR
jgi:hypothetical protein